MRARKKSRKIARPFLLLILILVAVLCVFAISDSQQTSLTSFPEYSGSPYIEINDNQPEFNANIFGSLEFELYSKID